MIANLAVDLTEVLAQGEHVKDLVDESVVNLASVNSPVRPSKAHATTDRACTSNPTLVL